MSKKNKKQKKMIDMSARLNIKVVPATQEEILCLDKELNELSLNIENIMLEYENRLSNTIDNMLLNGLKFEKFEEKDSSYFINKYDEIFKKRSKDHIQNRLEHYMNYLENHSFND